MELKWEENKKGIWYYISVVYARIYRTFIVEFQQIVNDARKR